MAQVEDEIAGTQAQASSLFTSVSVLAAALQPPRRVWAAVVDSAERIHPLTVRARSWLKLRLRECFTYEVYQNPL